MKITCLGAGGLYFLHPLGHIAVNKLLRGSRVDLYDIDQERSAMMAGAARRFSDEAGARLDVRVARSLAAAVEGADFVIASIGGAGASGSHGYYLSPLHVTDCVICARHGVPQIVGDTCGPAAMAAAFRSVPIYLRICREMEKRAPSAILLNHANPMAVLCRAMNKYSRHRAAIGVCHGVQRGAQALAKMHSVPAAELDVRWIGSNHYYWVTSVRRRGLDLMPKLWRQAAKGKVAPENEMCRDLSVAHGGWILYPADDHAIEFYPFRTQVPDARRLPYSLSQSHHCKELAPYYQGKKTIKDLIAEDRKTPRAKMLAEYAKRLDEAKLPKEPDSYLETESTSALFSDIASGARRVHILNIPNQGAVPTLPAEAVLELECVSDAAGVRGICAGQAPLGLEALLRKRIAWQELVTDAAVKGDRGLALQAMMIDEQAILPLKAKAMLEELLLNSREMLPQFRF